jgi:NAD(P)H dehydrogenase (quinone)
MTARIAVVYHSATGRAYSIAQAVAEGAAEAGAEVRLRRMADLDATADVPVVTLDDLTWADGFALGTPAPFGKVSALLEQFIDSTSGLWQGGRLAGRPAIGFTSGYQPHGGPETTLVALHNVLDHWGAVILPTGYVDYEVHDPMAAARFQGGRLARLAAALATVRAPELTLASTGAGVPGSAPAPVHLTHR